MPTPADTAKRRAPQPTLEAERPQTPEWLLLIHQIPPEPAYLRVKIGRRLARAGAVPVKNSVYVLPARAETREDFAWIAKEIESGGGEATVCEARFVQGQDATQIIERFREARAADYTALAEEARKLATELNAAATGGEMDRAQARKDSQRLRRRLAEIRSLDFFEAPGRAEAEAALLGVEGHLRTQEIAMGTPSRSAALRSVGSDKLPVGYQGRTWVTRQDVHVDRMACAWLIRRFIDPKARFRFVQEATHVPVQGELRFDMFEGEFTHEGDACSFEVLIRRLGLERPGLHKLAELIHDLDVKDGKYGRPETEGLGLMLRGIAGAHAKDEERLARSGALLDDMLAAFEAA